MNPHTHKGYYALNVARLPFRHFGISRSLLLDPSHTYCTASRRALMWWAIEDLNLGPLACEASALTAELIALATPARLGPPTRLVSTTLFGVHVTLPAASPLRCPRGVATTGFEPVT